MEREMVGKIKQNNPTFKIEKELNRREGSRKSGAIIPYQIQALPCLTCDTYDGGKPRPSSTC